MKMANWTLTDKDNEILVLQDEPLSMVNDTRKIIVNSKIDFRKLLRVKKEKKLLYDENLGKEVLTPIKVTEKHIGYRLKYKYDKLYPKFSLDNAFGVFYQKKPADPVWEPLFEDKIVRLCGYRHSNNAIDYLLFCRNKWERKPFMDDSIWLTMKCLLNMQSPD